MSSISTFDLLHWQSAAVVAVTLVTSVVLWSIIAAATSPLRRVPGPFIARFTKLWYARQMHTGQFHLENIKLHERYGPVVRLAPNMYSVNTPDAIKIIYGAGSRFHKTRMYTAFRPAAATPRNDLFTEQDPHAHRENRRKVTNIYSSTALIKMEASIPECMSALRHEFNRIASSGETVDMAFWLQCYALDFILLTTLGERLCRLEGAKDVNQMMHKLDRWLWYSAIVGPFGQYHWIITKLLGSRTPVEQIGFWDIILPAFTKAMESTETSHKSQKWTALEEMLSVAKVDESKISPVDALVQCMTNVLAGSDTTSLSMSAVMYYLIQQPECMAKLRAEIESARQQGRYSDPPTYQECQGLKYLQACIHEALRLHSAVGLPLERYVPPEGAEIAGVHFPGGVSGPLTSFPPPKLKIKNQTVVGVNTWAIHYAKSIFGPDAHLFRPERWIEGSEEHIRELERCWIPFGPIGPRLCIGQGISMMEMSTLLPELVRGYDFELDNGGQPMEAVNIWFVKPTNLFCKIKVVNQQDQV